MYKSLSQLTAEQITDLAEMIMYSAYEKIRDAQEQQNNVEILTDEIKEFASYTLSVFWAQTTGDSCGTFDWPGYEEFHLELERLRFTDGKVRLRHAASIYADSLKGMQNRLGVVP